jgi:hypothetical protein
MATLVRINPRLLAEITDQPNSSISPIAGYEKEDLVSLELACEPVQSMFNGELTGYILGAKSNSTSPTDGLTPDESAAIRLYTKEWDVRTQSIYRKLNQALRVGDPVQLRPWFKYLKLLLTAFFKLP